MKGYKNILIHDIEQKEYDKLIEWKNTHNKPTWKEMMFDYVDIKKAEEKMI